MNFIDVGAANDLQPRWLNIKDYINTTLFEPNKNSFLKLQQSKHNKIYNIGLFEKNELDLNCTKLVTNSSLFHPNEIIINNYHNPERFKLINKEKILLSTLDYELGKYANYDFIKLDVQGAELPILKGGVDTLDNIMGIEIEIEFKEIYKSQPLFSETNSFLEKNNFILIDFINLYRWEKDYQRNYGTIMFCDALYLKDPNYVVAKYFKDRNFDKIENYLKILFIYNQLDLIKNLRDKLSNDDRVKLNIENKIKNIEKNFKNLIFLNKIFNKLGQLIFINGKSHWLS